MNLKRAIGGFLLSFAFLLFFAYMISGVQWVFKNCFQSQSRDMFLGSVSVGVENVSLENAPTAGNATLNIVQPTPVSSSAPEINAKSAISVESNLKDINKIIFDKNSDTQLPIASLTKLMTAVIVLDNPGDSYDLSNTIVVDKAADSQDPMKQDVKLGDKMTIESFLDIMLVESSNKSAYALSEVIGEKNFVALMNQKAKDVGLENTVFIDPTGLSPEDVSTANDLAKLAEYILKNYPKIADISNVKEFFVPGFGNVENTDELLGEIPDIICSKTGFTTVAKGCLLLVTNNPKNNDYLINVILGADDRFSEMKKLISLSNAICNYGAQD